MNCKPGDLAIIVKTGTGKNVGKIVRVLRKAAFDGLVKPDGGTRYGVVWQTDTNLEAFNGTRHPYALDEYLRPIRDPGDDAQDETLQWLPVPVEGVPA